MGGISVDTLLDYAEFHIFSSQNRYEVCICSGNNVETVASGLLEQLLQHLPKVHDLCSKGSDANFKLQRPENLNGAKWFTKSTLTRFLHIVGSPDILNVTKAIENEISLLEESRRFHLSLYAKDHFGIGETDNRNKNGMVPTPKAEVDTVTSDPSKNELLRAMDLRLTALRGELATAFSRAAGATFSPTDITDLEEFSEHFGAINLRNCLLKFSKLSQKNQIVDFQSDDESHSAHNSSNQPMIKTEEDNKISKLPHSIGHVKYGVSPAKVAQVERESSTENDESSSSEEDQPSVERSRTLVRSASPRRSASPMRRVQIGRSGSRRSTAIAIKSLGYFPARERLLSHRDADANSSEEEGSEQPTKKSESNLQRMSVQDAIHLFESKQRDQTVDIQKKSFLDTSVSANKSVLRRWSAGMGESSVQSLTEIVPESSVPMTSNNLEAGEIPNSSLELKPESDVVSGGHKPVETSEIDVKFDTYEQGVSHPVRIQADNPVTQSDDCEKLTNSAEWNRQKEAELNQMLLKMIESKPVKYRNMAPDNCRSQNVPLEQKGGFYNHYKEKRNEKFQGEAAGKRAEREAQFRAMQRILDERKAEMASANMTEVSKKPSLSKPQKPHKNLSPSMNAKNVNPKKETSKPAVVKKASSKASTMPCKASTMPAVRKSWPSTPSPRAIGTSPAKTPGGNSSAGTTPTRRKPQTMSSVPRSSPKVEPSQQRPKNIKSTRNDAKNNMKGVNEKKQPVIKTAKSTKTVQTTAGDQASLVSAKPSFYSKGTKKSSVVPLESKPFLRKGSGIGPGVGPVVVKTKVSSKPEEALRTSESCIQAQENEVVSNNSDLINHQQDRDIAAPEIDASLESETQVTNNQQKCDDTGSSGQVIDNGDDSFKEVAESALNTEAEESIISPSAWVEIEEHQELPIPSNNTCQIESPVHVAPVAISSPRVRHSLSQMLLEESSEPDTIEWGNAENPPAIIYQKDAPKGLKRLLKFARKSRPDANSTGCSSPSAFSEGEDDTEESKASSKKNAADNLLRKAALHSKNYGQQSTHELLSAHSNIGKFAAQSSSHKLQEGHISAAATTTKATRSFFSLSAFRGSKPNETKLR